MDFRNDTLQSFVPNRNTLHRSDSGYSNACRAEKRGKWARVVHSTRDPTRPLRAAYRPLCQTARGLARASEWSALAGSAIPLHHVLSRTEREAKEQTQPGLARVLWTPGVEQRVVAWAITRGPGRDTRQKEIEHDRQVDPAAAMVRQVMSRWFGAVVATDGPRHYARWPARSRGLRTRNRRSPLNDQPARAWTRRPICGSCSGCERSSTYIRALA